MHRVNLEKWLCGYPLGRIDIKLGDPTAMVEKFNSGRNRDLNFQFWISKFSVSIFAFSFSISHKCVTLVKFKPYLVSSTGTPNTEGVGGGVGWGYTLL